MDLALCYENVLPARGGCETYIASLARRLVRDGHDVHLYACRWDADALPPSIRYHRIATPRGPRFLRPWRFASACERALAAARHDVTMGFDKTWGQDILYPQGGLHAAAAFHNRLKHRSGFERLAAIIGKRLDPAAWSFARLERRQYFGPDRPVVIAISQMVRRHFERFYGAVPDGLRVIHAAIDPQRFAAEDRTLRRSEQRRSLGVGPDEPVGLFVAMNYRLKGLGPLIRSLAYVPREKPFRLAVVGHPKDGAYRRLAERLGVADRIRFLGFRADPKDTYFAADFLIHPTFYDPCSLVALEALACGLPVITSRFNGAAELLDPPESGLVVGDPHDAPALGGAIAQMLDPDYRTAAAEAARRKAAQWTFEHHYRALQEVFADVQRRKQAA